MVFKSWFSNHGFQIMVWHIQIWHIYGWAGRMEREHELKAAMLSHLVAFVVGEQHYALPLRTVQQVLRTVAITPLPKAPEVVLGVIDFKGHIIPVMSMRKRFGLAEPETSLSDELIVADTSTRSVALVVNSVIGVVEKAAEEVTEAQKILPGTQYVEGITRLQDGILFIHDLECFLSKKEEQQLDGLVSQAVGRG
jgi:purine-binding chemotaxis protein CheW